MTYRAATPASQWIPTSSQCCLPMAHARPRRNCSRTRLATSSSIGCFASGSLAAASPMISPFPDRTLLLASLRDYVAQLREEGLDGLPRGAVIITGGEGAAAGAQPQPPPPRPPSVASDANSAPVRSREPAPPAPATRTAAAPIIARNGADAWRTKYPGLVQTGD